jgi:hypothetical protein
MPWKPDEDRTTEGLRAHKRIDDPEYKGEPNDSAFVIAVLFSVLIGVTLGAALLWLW